MVYTVLRTFLSWVDRHLFLYGIVLVCLLPIVFFLDGWLLVAFLTLVGLSVLVLVILVICGELLYEPS